MSYADFKIGTRVKFIAENGVGHRDALKGDVGVIISMDDYEVVSDTLVSVMTDRGVEIRVNPHRLNVLAPPTFDIISIPRPTFAGFHNVEPHHSPLSDMARVVAITDPYAGFVVGARVRMINEHPRWSAGAIKVGDIGVLKRAKPEVENGWIVEFPNHRSWNGMAITDLELVEAPVVELTPELAGIPLDEAVKSAKAIKEEIRILQAKLSGFEQVMTKAGIKFI